MPADRGAGFGRWLGSLPVAIFALGLLMAQVVVCTLGQVELGTFGAVDAFIRTWIVWGVFPGTHVRIPVFPGGAVAGLLLTVNLVAAMVYRLEPSWRKAGLWLTHVGLVLLIAGEFVTAGYAVETSMAVENGETKAYAESTRRFELALRDTSAKDHDRVYAVDFGRLRAGVTVDDARLPVRIRVVETFPNGRVGARPPHAALASPVTRGAGLTLEVTDEPEDRSDEGQNTPAAFVELLRGGRSLGVWLASTTLASQRIDLDGKPFALDLRPARAYLPFALTLVKFHHDIYPGTDIPKNFSSQVHLSDAQRREDRDVLIWMNHPLRYRGYTFYQSSFGKQDTMSVFAVVRNPGWTMPYLSCLLVALGLAIHFLGRLRESGS